MRQTISEGIEIILVTVFCGIVLIYAMRNPAIIDNGGHIKTVDLQCDTEFIDWQVMDPDSNRTELINVQDTGNADVTLTLNCSNWDPVNASQFLTLTWNYTGAVLHPLQWTPIELTLTVSDDVAGIQASNVTSFSFDIWIIAEDA